MESDDKLICIGSSIFLIGIFSSLIITTICKHIETKYGIEQGYSQVYNEELNEYYWKKETK